MASNTRTFFGNRAAIYLYAQGGSVALADELLIVKDFKAEWTSELTPLYGNGSTARQDIARHTAKVDISFKFHKMDISPADSKLASVIASPVSTTVTFESGNGDTSEPVVFDMAVVLDSDESTASNNLKATIYDVAFTNFPISFSDTEWVGFEFTGEGAGILLENANKPAA